MSGTTGSTIPEIDYSGATSVTPGTATTVIAANPARRGFFLQNNHATATLCFKTAGTATTDGKSRQLGPGGYYETPAGAAAPGALSVVSSVASVPFACSEW